MKDVIWADFVNFIGTANRLDLTYDGLYSAVHRERLKPKYGHRPSNYWFHPEDIKRYDRERKIHWRKRKSKKMKIYVASSWRNGRAGEVIEALRNAGHEVYDFRNPNPGNKGFHWSEIDPEWENWTPIKFRESLNHPFAVEGFDSDFTAMVWAEACVLVMPCGRSAHLEAGYFVGASKPLYILLSDGEPELMYRMASSLCAGIPELLDIIK